MVREKFGRNAIGPTGDVLLTAHSLTKSFGATVALRAVDFELLAGETHVLFGENGAGKSTLVKILSGVVSADIGEIRIHGQRVTIGSPATARALGIATVFQDFSLVRTVSVLDNLFLGKEMTHAGLLDRRRMRVRAQRVFETLGIELDPTDRVARLSRAQQQMIEIAKALLDEASIMILDEPTSSLTDRETQHLFRIIDGFKRSGGAVVFISHRIAEVVKHGDRITVLRDGRKVQSMPRGAYNEGALINLITGHAKSDIFPVRHPASDEILLRVVGLTTKSGVRDLDFVVHKGEILGLAGLAGSGTSNVGRALVGFERMIAGTMTLDGKAIERPSPRRLRDQGVIYFPADRHEDAILPTRSVGDNISIGALERFTSALGFINARAERTEIAKATERLQIKMATPGASIMSLSGGNQQKVVLARAFLRDFCLLILDDPTVGVDIQTKTEIYRWLFGLLATGVAIILISSDLEELLALSHTVLVLRDGRSAAPLLAVDKITKEQVLELFFRGTHARAF
ncbi:MAG: sugar ABC transporter ATP-binding protein [Stellaceae bacterium]